MSNDDKIAAIIQNNPFIQVFARLKKGSKATEAADKIGQVIEAVKRTGKSGELTLKFTIEPDDKGEVRTVDIGCKITPKCPERKEQKTTFFVVGERSLDSRGTVDDQPEFDFDVRTAPTLPAIAKMPPQPTAAAGR